MTTTVDTSVEYFTALARFRAEWPVTTNPFAIEGHDIQASLVDHVDNQGEPCEICAEVDAPVQCVVYGIEVGEHANLAVWTETCVRCARSVAASMSATDLCTVEVARA